jgi:hypothetical protein
MELLLGLGSPLMLCEFAFNKNWRVNIPAIISGFIG